MAAILDVAKLAGVSKSTVSHVLNNTRFVSSETQRKVKEAAEALHYQPSVVARSLKVKTTKSLGMIVTSTDNPFYAEIISAAQKYCHEIGYDLILCNTEKNPIKTKSYIQVLSQRQVDGILVLCTTYDDVTFSTIAGQKKLPMVVLDSGPTVKYIDKIQDHSYRGGLIATEHLINLGHTRIAHIGGPENKLPAKQRFDGYCQALRDASLPINRDLVIESDLECEGGAAAIKKLLSLREPPSAVFVANDVMAMAAISVASQMGLRIPEDLSIVGYDNISLSEYFNPPLTTVNQHISELAELAVKTLIKRILGSSETETVVMIEPNLVVRQSTCEFKA
ncbi:LacI family DNA-binding transcriptional regulator [Alginatibacterium sediminis]|uniref:LacI family DNA-binding transcriptional regulator n=1 Tax=Alginatibacterium sediminis TaxID=2164068 RepID=A0A420EHW8_9ALTE|nr:substrate-binding domain-containing protein [Alginatibacterium sediminis]RKF20312.1 LacI family DNA-binding transcriptional regulator [Alginatibacterium sediminis]